MVLAAVWELEALSRPLGLTGTAAAAFRASSASSPAASAVRTGEEEPHGPANYAPEGAGTHPTPNMASACSPIRSRFMAAAEGT